MRQPNPLIIATTTLLLLACSISIALCLQTRTHVATAAQQAIYDHSGCQYPDRWSNPANGCDNSDPAVPECIKASYSQEAESACIAEFAASHQEEQQPQPPEERLCNE